MKVEIIGTDSMGVRGMATFVETKDVRIFIDPSAALGPLRYGLRPHSLEVEELEKRWKRIMGYASKSDVIIISHYHYDHYNPNEYVGKIYKNKKVFVKHPTENINLSQRKRAREFLEVLPSFAKEINYSDNGKVKFNETKIEFSNAVPHGPTTRLGYVIETSINDGKNSFLHTGDVEGPALEEQVEFILRHKPEIVFLDGPLSYIIYRYGNENLRKAIKNMKRILDSGVETLVYDHHFLRDKKYLELITPVKRYGANLGKHVLTGAEFMDEKNRPLELMRKELYCYDNEQES